MPKPKSPSAQALIAAAQQRKERELTDQLRAAKREIADGHKREKSLRDKIKQLHTAQAPEQIKIRPPAKAAQHIIRVVVPDSHGEHIDPVARDAFLGDLALLKPQEIVMLGDHLDCGGTFSAHQRSYTNELTESYAADLRAARSFLRAIRVAAPDARIDYLEGNHEAHVERWAARNVQTREDADLLLEVFGVQAQLHLDQLEIRYWKSKEFHDGLSVRGTIRRGKCHFTHGISHSKHADSVHLERFNGNVVFGHVHRCLEVRSRTVTSSGHGAWCSGTLAKLQPLYKHTEPTSWSHGYGVQFVNTRTGRFAHWNVPIFSDGTTGLVDAVGALK